LRHHVQTYLLWIKVFGGISKVAGMREHAERSRGCITTSYLPLSDIAELQHIPGVSGNNKGIEHLK